MAAFSFFGVCYVVTRFGPKKPLIEIRDMGEREIKEVLAGTGYGHLACSKGGVPYVVPIHYVYEDPSIYVYTTEGKKSDIIAENPNVCLQVEQIRDDRNWRSVIVNGRAEHLLNADEREKAIDSILKINPTLTPAVSVRWMDGWVKKNIAVVYRITALELTGKKAGSGEHQA